MTIAAVAAGAASPAQRQQVLEVLREVDQEFVPPLSARADTLSLQSVPRSADPGPRLAAYLHAMDDEAWLLAHREGRVVGVLSYVADHVEPVLDDHSPCLYVSTIAVSRRCRGSGLATALYEALSAQARRSAVPWIATRTWSTNTDHLRLLHDQGFTEVARQVRQGSIDSVYLARLVPRGRLT